MWILRSFVLVGIVTGIDGVLKSTVRARLGTDARLPCRLDIADANENTNVYWRRTKDGLLTSGLHVNQQPGRIEVEKTNPLEWNLRIKQVDQSFADKYTCVTDTKTISEVTLKIEVAPKINSAESSPSSVETPEHLLTELKCVFTGEPEPEVTWYRGYGTSKKPTNIKGSILRFRDIERYATDVYTCRGENSINHYEHVINVTVTFGPEVTVQKDTVYAVEGSLTVLACMIQGAPIERIYWKKRARRPTEPDEDIRTNWRYEVIDEKMEDTPVYFTRLMLRKALWGTHEYGTYECRADGSDVTQKGTIQLKNISEKPDTNAPYETNPES